MAPDHERAQLVGQSVQKFRNAIRLRPEFDRACYNLGTVYYSHAHTLSSSSAAQLSSQLTKVRSGMCQYASPCHTWSYLDAANGGARMLSGYVLHGQHVDICMSLPIPLTGI